jgi:undecaprenyl-diphosphatase
MDLLSNLIQLDQRLFILLNHTWANPLFDWLMPAITDLHKSPVFYICLLPVLIFWIKKQGRLAIKCLLALALAVSLSDIIAYRVIKTHIQRPRPPEAGISVDLRTPVYAGFSFPSNHAANMFAAAQILTLAYPPIGIPFYILAALIAFSRIYVGVHFPLDVLGGAILGISISTIVWLLLRRWVKS